MNRKSYIVKQVLFGVMAVLVCSPVALGQICPGSLYTLRFTDPRPIFIAVNGDSIPQRLVFEGSHLPTGCPVQVIPDSSAWSIGITSIATLNSCNTSSVCSVHGVGVGQTTLHVSASSIQLGLFNLEKMKPVVVTPLGQPPNQCLDAAGLVVPCGGGCVVAAAAVTASVRLVASASTLQINPQCEPHGTGVQIITSGDPNDKAGSQGVGPQQYISGATPLRYAVFFGNEPTATAPAQKVVVTDQLNVSSEDLTTFKLGPIALPNQLVSPPPELSDFSTTVDLRPSNNLLVAINTHLDVSTGLLTWTFQSLDPATNQPPTDPTAGFLPPGAGGSTFFTVMPKQGLPADTQIQNQATVVFDVNAPINTPTWMNMLDNTPPRSHISPLPAAENSPSFTVQWSGTDVGSGIQDFTIYVSDSGGPFTAFQTNTAATSALFQGQVGHTYAFYSLARDLVGNVEAAKSGAEASTQVTTDTMPPVTTVALTPAPNANGWNNANVTVRLNSADNELGRTGVKQITYSASGTQTIVSTVVSGSSTSFIVSTEGITTITFFGTDNAGNVEPPNTVTIKLDKTPPNATASRTPPPNVNGWNNSSVAVSFQCADSLSGLAVGSPPAPTTLSSEGAGQSVRGTCMDVAGNSAVTSVQSINIDRIPPILTASVNPPPNANGWENTDVTVSWAAVDALSGIGVVSGPVIVTTEGTGQVVSGSATDLAGNLATGSVTINLDKTPPEAFLQFDPIGHDVVLFGRDSVSGVAPGPIAPLSVVPIQLDQDGDDMDVPDADDVQKELRTYQVFDLAGNSLLLVEKVQRAGHHIAASIVSLQYGQGTAITLPPNRTGFEWSLAEDGTLKKLEQEFRAGRNKEAPRVNADFDSRKNQTTIVQQEPEAKTKTLKQGLALLRMATSAGKLSIEF